MTDGHNPQADQAIRVRDAQPDDLPAIVDFNYALALETEDITLDREVLHAGVRRALDDAPRLRYFVAECSAGKRRIDNGKRRINNAERPTDKGDDRATTGDQRAPMCVIGQLGITTEWSDWRNAFLWWIQSVYVIQSERRAGVFGMLYSHVVAQARREPDVCGIRLYVHNTNERAMAAYRRMGMRASEYLVFEDAWNPMD